jgi:dipeptidyl-peptidase-4
VRACSWFIVLGLLACQPAVVELDVTGSPAQSLADPLFLEQVARTRSFTSGQPVMIKPTAGAVYFLRSGPQDAVRALYRYELASGATVQVLSASDLLGGAEEALSEEERARRERQRLAARGITGFEVSRDGRTLLVPLSGRVFVVEAATGRARELSSEAGAAVDVRWSPDEAWVAAVRGDGLYVTEVASGVERRLTPSEGPEVSWGSAEFVAQEEMHRMHGYWWSPAGAELLVQRTDTTGMERFHLADLGHPERPPSPRPYPRAGGRNAEVRLFVVRRDGSGQIEVQWDRERWPYLASVSWTAHGPPTVVVQDRLQQEEAVLVLDPRSGSCRLLHVETDPTWINLDESLPVWLSAEEGWLWSTERDGAWQIELRSPAGTRVRALTEPELGYRRLIRVDRKARELWVEASADPTSRQVVRVSIDGAWAPRPVTDGVGLHGVVHDPSGDVAVFTRVGLDQPRSWEVQVGGVPAGALTSVAEPAPAPRLELTTVGEDRLRAAVIRPRVMEAGRSYPVLVHVYGGPRHPMVVADPGVYLLDQWYADHGFVVVAIDGRGTPHRGRAWERAIHRDVISAPLLDQVAGLQALGARYPEMDLSRVGIFGWSFGGYFSAHAVLQRPDVFHAAVAGAPVADWHDYDTHYTERYMGLPADNVEGYRHTSVLSHVENSRHPLFIVHGTEDDNVWFSHALRMSDALFRAGKPHDFLPLTGFSHMVADPLVLRRRHEAVARFLVEALQTR